MTSPITNQNSLVTRNLDVLLVGNPCSQNCRQCFANERAKPIFALIEKEFVERILARNSQYKRFVYPKDIIPNMDLLETMQRIGQTSVLTTGVMLAGDKQKYQSLVNTGIREIGFTLFADDEEQGFWNKNTPAERDAIKQAIQDAKRNNFKTKIHTIVTPENITSLPSLYQQIRELGGDYIKLLRLLPIGRGARVDTRYRMTQPALEELLTVTDSLKDSTGPYLSFAMSFGPDYRRQSKKPRKLFPGEDWTSTTLPCPVIDGNYIGVSAKSGLAYLCFLLTADPTAVIGNVTEEGEIHLNNRFDLSPEALKDNLRGMCSSESCEYQSSCLGGCRAAAFSFARLQGEAAPEYAGMDLCRTQTRKKMQSVIETK